MEVVAAVIERDGRILICQRKGGRHALKWEFPGGKVEPGEQFAAALARELREELGIEAIIGTELCIATVSDPPAAPIALHFYKVIEFTGEPVNLQFENMVWEERRRLTRYDFLEGDVEFVKKLAAE